MRLAWAGIHRGEEPPLTASGGSGAMFFTGCTLRCAFCQNHQISRCGMGRKIDLREFSEIALRLQAMGTENLNLITATQFIPSIVAGVAMARERGLKMPVLWNSSGYESPAALDALSGTVSVWLPDLKTLEPETARSFFGSADYPERATAAIKRMAAMGGVEIADGRMRRGTIVRHLVLPGRLEESRAVFAWFAENLGGRALISVMTQYTPILAMPGPGSEKISGAITAPDRFVDTEEYESIMEMLEEYGLEGGFYQELETGSDWLPDFARPAPFSSELSAPLWHWAKGFLA
jgi:putative pyruvate formate lyase activating enzyme